MENPPTRIYVGPRSAVIAEIGTPEFYSGKWLVAPFSPTADHIPGGCSSKKEAADQVKWWRKAVPGVTVVWL